MRSGQLQGNPSRHPARAGIIIVTVMTRGKMSVMTTSMAQSRWPRSREARGQRHNNKTSGSQRRKSDKSNKDKYTIEMMLDQPCKFHSVSGKPASHTMR
jgi:hypothetical protein